MTPDETLVLRAETDVLSDEWYDMLMSALIPARALHLGRPVLANEFFGKFQFTYYFFIVNNIYFIYYYICMLHRVIQKA